MEEYLEVSATQGISPAMNWADWTILAILVISSLISIKRGFIKEALSLLTWAAAIVVAMLFRDQMALLLMDSIQTPSARQAVAFAALFLGTLIIGSMLNFLLGELVRITGLSGTDRLLGMLFGLARGAIVVMAALIFVPRVLPVAQDPWWQQSTLIPQFLLFEDWSRQTASEITERLLQLF